MRHLLALAILAFPVWAMAADVPRIKVLSSPAIPKGGEIIIVPAGQKGPGTKDFKAALQSKQFEKELDLPGAGPFDVYFALKAGKPVLTVGKWQVEKGVNELKLSSYLGTVFVRSDDLPRADSVVLTATDDPGPGEKGHVAIQAVNDYKVDLVVPAGFYAVWIVPTNGAKAQKIADKIRVLAGRETQFPE